MTCSIHHFGRLSMTGAREFYGLTARALRFYEAQGLIEARRDARNSRYYDGVARERLEWVVRLRQADIPLADIREVLDAGPEQRTACAAGKLLAARARAATLAMTIENLLAELQRPRFSTTSSRREVG
jgi:DNA-binding transcriptional MerR regulator